MMRYEIVVDGEGTDTFYVADSKEDAIKKHIKRCAEAYRATVAKEPSARFFDGIDAKEVNEAYRRAEKLVAMGLATKHEENDYIDFDVDGEGYAWIYPDDKTVTVYYGDDGDDDYDCGDIDLQKMQVIGRKDDYDIIKEVY